MNILSPKFENFQNQVQNQKYFEIMQTFMDKGHDEHMEFVFKLFCYDKDHKDRITEKGLFQFMRDASIKGIGVNPNPTDPLPLT